MQAWRGPGTEPAKFMLRRRVCASAKMTEFHGARPRKKDPRNLGSQFLESEVKMDPLLKIARFAIQRHFGAGSAAGECQITPRTADSGQILRFHPHFQNKAISNQML
ncbi:MAG: hypothetical protein ABSA47_10955 [Verrucomicrobiota bacterium]